MLDSVVSGGVSLHNTTRIRVNLIVTAVYGVRNIGDEVPKLLKSVPKSSTKSACLAGLIILYCMH